MKHGSGAENGGKSAKKLAKSAKKCLLLYGKSAKIFIRDTLKSLLLRLKSRARDHKEVKQDEQVRINRCSECEA